MPETSNQITENTIRWGRRIGVAIVWAVVNYGLALAQKPLGIPDAFISILLEKSTWIVGLLITGLSATDVVERFKAQ
jgi:hypothetical protein